MKPFLTIVLLCLSSCFLLAQDSLKTIKALEAEIYSNLKTNHSCDLNDIYKVISYHKKNLADKMLNQFFANIYSHNSQELDLNFLQGLISLSLNTRTTLDANNTKMMEQYYADLRIRYLNLLLGQQQLLLTNAQANLYNKKDELAFANLTEVMKIHDSRIQSNNTLIGETNNITSNHQSFQFAYKAFIMFLQALPVDDYRFKMFAKDGKHTRFRNFNDRESLILINKKLDAAGYEPIQTKPLRGATIDLEKLKEEEAKEEEAFRKKYDWIKKQ